MKLSPPRVPLTLPVIIAVLIVLGIVAGPLIRSNFTEEQRAANVLLEALPFIFIFVAVVLTFITLIILVASMLNHNIPRNTYQLVERIIIAGIVGGVVGMFQPWWFLAYKYGFVVLLVSTLAFILWSHIQPRGVYRHEELSSVSITEIEQQKLEGND
jgi:zinc transporter ZupT